MYFYTFYDIISFYEHCGLFFIAYKHVFSVLSYILKYPK